MQQQLEERRASCQLAPETTDKLAACPTTTIEYAGWMPVFKRFGNCGKHPLFAHRDTPPEGYAFTCSDPRDRPPSRILQAIASLARLVGHAFTHGPWRCVSTLAAAGRLLWRLRRNGSTLRHAAHFVHSRHFESQVMRPRSKLAFLTSIPFTFGQDPWVVEVEDSTTLLYPYYRNGETYAIDPATCPYLPMVKTLLEDDSCQALVTHIRSTAESLPILFGSERLRSKVFHIPLGVPLPPRAVEHKDRRRINLLFTNSWHQTPRNFFLRGGLDVLEAFRTLRVRYPQLRLILRSSLPRLPRRYTRMLRQDGVHVIGHFLDARQMQELNQETDIFLLPSARIHIVSLLQAMSYGQAVVTADGWGVSEHLDDDRTGLIVRGRLGKTSWLDAQTGLLREDYRPTFRPDPAIVARLIDAVSKLVEDVSLRRRLGAAAREEVATNHRLDLWNAGLQRIFDQILERGHAR